MREVLGNFQWRVRAFVLLLLDIIAMGVASFLALWVQSEFVFSDIGKMYYGRYMGICRSML